MSVNLKKKLTKCNKMVHTLNKKKVGLQFLTLKLVASSKINKMFNLKNFFEVGRTYQF